MFAIERMNKIKEILFKDKRVDVFELSELFSVTEVTIRRDLDKLEQMGFLVKIYGGAVLKEDAALQPLIAESEDELIEEKRMIGKIASHMIDDGDAIYLSPGTTSLEIARNLKGKKTTVVTNDITTALELKDAAGSKVLLTGGDLIPSTSKLVGGFTLQTLEGIHINKAFIGVKGAHLDTGYTVDTYEETMVVQQVKKISSEIIMVADYTKFNRKGFAKLGDLLMADKVITNKQIPAEYKKYYFENAVKLYTTYDFD
ncbi:DeoR faimly transcriptional regulator [Paenibacillus darwinianus]|uniref:DeoR faimly transcriptional regulator n=1 Tax=Paenibacillus darwinianus TaxID=1380763 RepID=A0A9W5RZZ7_9BACL|nr:DeoR/GlpR family DNA-binding transcription regulator [Paenibacillus darwinianus]EXX85734.1 DeoR faimly transcriptional regulator [Paenibacillus darwinianus]EXX85803.1 DeoR faimly transcriptional regulator [Paenibacillus darwinianus]